MAAWRDFLGMANLIKRGATFYVRLHIPLDHQRDVGGALGASGGIKREVVKTSRPPTKRAPNVVVMPV